MRPHPRDLLTDESWAVVKDHFPKRTRPGTGRVFLEALLFKARTGIAWRDLPARFGRWEAHFQRFSWWSKRGFFTQIAQAIRDHVGVDLTEASLDSTSVKIHASAHGSQKKQPRVGPVAAGTPKSMRSSMPPADCGGAVDGKHQRLRCQRSQASHGMGQPRLAPRPSAGRCWWKIRNSPGVRGYEKCSTRKHRKRLKSFARPVLPAPAFHRRANHIPPARAGHSSSARTG